MMHKLKKFTDLKKLIFSNNDFSSLNQVYFILFKLIIIQFFFFHIKN